ncbi:dnaJ homolog subfamily C member 7 [Diachasma alloeum]|uniref:dnaJ homolog subfamily C member 7 n=1 Tax=Diachasma alloeum TaxID=454923 RepID=UPI00073819B8|nr:dnaJ homolog subfamily C member 7 [Diachasma alloeum]XP_015117870.1 dnaJ homolog subfamily C member 7 [Diachasma alloeum]XP_015117871.1 dnaJ homolog subfamily C member 7 [Diachasma alloeum]XP_015117872.1 dnaJ homolog subfamily C member 7 [Diachasma alloeum]XP_015117873.1 dnaJ homolog subfamily C member 7 [Diachasma alloeum]XP_015117874.1 dnaJ homolog subfamily C member 7 [Diachasma alloeum]
MEDLNDDNNNAGALVIKEDNSGSYNTINHAIEKIKEEAAKLFKEKKYYLAVSNYSRLIEMCPNEPVYYANRAASYMMMENYVNGLADAKQSVELNPAFIKGHCRVILCAMRLHRFSEMDSSIGKLKMIDPTNDMLQYQVEQMRELVMNLENELLASNAGNYVKVLEYIDKCLAICPQFMAYKVKKADCLLVLGRLIEAAAVAREIVERDPSNSDGHYVLGKCLRETNIKLSVFHFGEAFRLNPYCSRDRTLHESGKKIIEKRTDANNAYRLQNYAQAHYQYSTLLLECAKDAGFRTALYFNMAQASYKMGNLERCLQECGTVLNLQPNHLNALMRRAQCHMDRKNYTEAIKDLEKAWGIESSAEVLQMLQETHKRLGDSHNGPYVILGLLLGAPRESIIKAYRELTKVHHPDRHANATDEQKTYHEMKCKEITRAYRLLMEMKPTGGTNSNNSNGKQRETNSAPKPSPRGSTTNFNNSNGHQSSSGGANHNSAGSESGGRGGARGSNNFYGQQYSPGGMDNNSAGSQPRGRGAARHSHDYYWEQSSAGGSNRNSTGSQARGRGAARGPYDYYEHQSSPGGTGGDYDRFHARGRGAARGPHDYYGQQPPAGGSNQYPTGFKSSAGGSNNHYGRQYTSGGTHYNSNGGQPTAGGSRNYSGKDYNPRSENHRSAGPRSSAGTSNTHNRQQFSGNSESKPAGAYRDDGKAKQTSSRNYYYDDYYDDDSYSSSDSESDSGNYGNDYERNGGDYPDGNEDDCNRHEGDYDDRDEQNEGGQGGVIDDNYYAESYHQSEDDYDDYD